MVHDRGGWLMFSPTVEAWRSLVREHASGIPVEFLLAWISWESGGNPAALGSMYEVGLFQINMADGPQFGGDVNSLHRNFAAPSSQKADRKLTDTEKVLQVTTGVAQAKRYLSLSEQRVGAVGSNWGRASSDIWCMTKLHHGLPALPSAFLPAYRSANGRGPSGWGEFARWLNGLTYQQAYVIHPGAAAYYGSKGKPAFRRFTDNAEASGNHGGVEFLGGFVSLALIALALGAGALFALSLSAG